FLADPRGPGIAKDFAVFPCQADLGCDLHLVAKRSFGKRLADDLLGTAETIGRRRVDQRYAAFHRRANGGDGLSFVGAAPHPAADRPGAKSDSRVFGPALCDCNSFHDITFATLRMQRCPRPLPEVRRWRTSRVGRHRERASWGSGALAAWPPAGAREDLRRPRVPAVCPSGLKGRQSRAA